MIQTQAKLSRPRSVTITLWGVIAFGVWNLARALAIWQEQIAALNLEISPDPRWRALLALAWALLFLGMAGALWRKRPFSRRFIPALFVLFTLAELAILQFWRVTPLNPQAWQLPLVIYGLAVLASFWSLNRNPAKIYLEKGEP